MHRIIQKIKEWYRGEYIPPPANDANSGIVFVSPGYYEPSLSAKIVRALAGFWRRNWRTLLSIIVAASVALFIHFDSKSASKPKQKENHQISSANHNQSLFKIKNPNKKLHLTAQYARGK